MPVETKTIRQYAIKYADGEIEQMPDRFSLSDVVAHSNELSSHVDPDDPALYEHKIVTRQVTTTTTPWA